MKGLNRMINKYIVLVFFQIMSGLWQTSKGGLTGNDLYGTICIALLFGFSMIRLI